MAVLATFRAKCPACGDPIQRQDEIERTEVGWTHLACAEVVTSEPRPQAICEGCWLTIPCECDECGCNVHAAMEDFNA